MRGLSTIHRMNTTSLRPRHKSAQRSPRRSVRHSAHQRPDYWAQAAHELAQSDAVMAALIQRYPDSIMVSRGQPFYALVALDGGATNLRACR